MGSHVTWIDILALSLPTVTGILTEKKNVCRTYVRVGGAGGGGVCVQQSNNWVDPGVFDKGAGRGHYCHTFCAPFVSGNSI